MKIIKIIETEFQFNINHNIFNIFNKQLLLKYIYLPIAESGNETF